MSGLLAACISFLADNTRKLPTLQKCKLQFVLLAATNGLLAVSMTT